MMRSYPVRLVPLLLWLVAAPGWADVSMPFAPFQEVYRAPEVIRDATWPEMMADPGRFAGQRVGLQVQVKGRIDDAQQSDLLVMSRDGANFRITSPGGCSAAGLGQWLAVVVEVAPTGPHGGLVAVAATAIAEPQRPQITSEALVGGANGAAGIGGAGAAPFAESPTEAVQEPLHGGIAPASPEGLQQREAQPAGQAAPQTAPAVADTSRAAAIIDSFIYSRNKRVPAAERQLIASEILRWSQWHGMRWEFFTAMITAESNFNRRAVSSAGALGLGQLMPFNCRTYGVADPFDIRQNLRGSAQHLREFLDKYRDREPWTQLSLTLASYNAGPGAVRKYGGVPPYNETRTYIQRVAKVYMQLVAMSSGGA